MAVQGTLATVLVGLGLFCPGVASADDFGEADVLRTDGSAADSGTARAVSSFDMRDLPVPDARSLLRSQRLSDLSGRDAAQGRMKLRLRYEPQQGGPRFEVGSLGSRKGTMKRKLLHVAMDWAF